MGDDYKPGIDIVGFPCGKLGIGDQTRSLIKLAMKSGYDVNLIDCIHPSDNIRNDHYEFSHLITNKFKNPLRIYSLTQNHIAALIYRFGVEFFNNGTNIFQLAWEFDARPQELDAVLRFSDEIWGISNFVSKAFVNDMGIPVRTMPNAVEIPEFNKRTRSDFGLPDKTFLFCYSFDFNSWLTRKNPYAAIQAFQCASFNTAEVGLVIKVSNAREGAKEWREFVSLVKDSAGIYVINEVYEKEKVLALYDCCDCFISLHRSEGYGISLAENMMLKKPVICTGYSGNMDFCNEDNSYIVDFKEIDVKNDEYSFSNGMVWADPIIESAAHKMKEVVSSCKSRNTKVENAYRYIVENYSTEALSGRFDDLIQDFVYRKNIVVNDGNKIEGPKKTCPGISVVIPNWNGLHLLKQSLDPLLRAANEYKGDVDIIIVDNGSQDRSVDVVTDYYPQIRIVEFDRNTGFGYACNAGVEEARYDHVLLLNNDIYLPENFFSIMIESFLNIPDCFSLSPQTNYWRGKKLTSDVFSSSINVSFDDNGDLIQHWGVDNMKNISKPISPTFYGTGAALLVDKSKFEALGGFDSLYGLAYWEDVDLCLRAWRKGWSSYYTNSVVAWHRISASSSNEESHGFKERLMLGNYILFHFSNISDLKLTVRFSFKLYNYIRQLRSRGDNDVADHLVGIVKDNILRVIARRIKLAFFSKTSFHNVISSIPTPVNSWKSPPSLE